MRTTMTELPALGSIVADKYRLDHLVGEGGMGCVYRAHHLILGTSVAIKFLNAALDSAEGRSRFLREAKATIALKGEHVVRVFDLGVLSSTNTPYMVMELLEGTDLRALLAEHGHLSVTDAVDHVLQVCEGLAEAHMNGIVHRDLKPQNLFLTRRANGTPCVKLLDFGISKLERQGLGSEELTQSNVMIGSPAFVSPEQIRDARNVDARADIWSLGIVLYMLLGGERPFQGEGLAALCASIVVDEPTPLRARCPHVPDALESVIFRCLKKRRDERFANVAELAEQLLPHASPLGRASGERVIHTYKASDTPSVPAPSAAPSSTTTTSGIEIATRTAGEPPRLESNVATLAAAPAPKTLRRFLPALAIVGLLGLGGAGVALKSRLASTDVQTPASGKDSSPALYPDTVPVNSAPAPVVSAAPPVSAPAHVASATPKAYRPPLRGRVTTKPKGSGPVDRNGMPIID